MRNKLVHGLSGAGVWAMLGGRAASVGGGLFGLQLLAINLAVLADPVTAPVD